MSVPEEAYMQRCLQLAQLGEGNVAPNPMVGAVLVCEKRVIGEGYHQQYGQPHAEVNCIDSVPKEAEPLIAQSTMYVSLEPCAHFGKTPPCADLIIRHCIPRVVVGCRDPFEAVDGKGIEKLLAANIEVEMGMLGKECVFLNRRFFTFHKKKRPYVILKWAQTADGSIAFQNQEKEGRLHISNDTANRTVHRWRSNEAAILVGKQTAMLDNPSLTNRLWSGKSPTRLVIDKNLAIGKDKKIRDSDAPTIIFSHIGKQDEGHVRYVTVAPQADFITAILQYCYTSNIQSILVEGGKKLLASFIDQDVWDEAHIITNENMVVHNGLKAPSFLQQTETDHRYQLGNNRVDVVYHPHLKEL